MVTDRDRSIVEWIGRLGAASAADVMARFGMGRTATYRRLRALVDQGLLSHGALAVRAAGAVRRYARRAAVGAPGAP